MKNVTGMAIAVVGMTIYSCAVEAEKQLASSKVAIGKEERVRLFNEGMEQSLLKDVESGVCKG